MQNTFEQYLNRLVEEPTFTVDELRRAHALAVTAVEHHLPASALTYPGKPQGRAAVLALARYYEENISRIALSEYLLQLETELAAAPQSPGLYFNEDKAMAMQHRKAIFKNMNDLDPVSREKEIFEELAIAGIPVTLGTGNKGGSKFSARLEGFSFTRAGCYWEVAIADRMIPLTLAEKIYASEIGKKHVRIEGNAEAVNPSERFEVDKTLFAGTETNYDEEMRDDRERTLVRCSSYHIDTQAGLNFFVSAVREFYGQD